MAGGLNRFAKRVNTADGEAVRSIRPEVHGELFGRERLAGADRGFRHWRVQGCGVAHGDFADVAESSAVLGRRHAFVHDCPLEFSRSFRMMQTNRLPHFMNNPFQSRRKFLQTTSAAAIAAPFAGTLLSTARAAESERKL